MTIHIGAKKGEIAESVLLPGDPLRAKFIAENFLENAVCYSEVRGMYGYTGSYKGKRISVQGTGMGLPSISIYVNELIRDYGCKNLVRIGSAGSMKKEVELKDIVLSIASSCESNMNSLVFKGMDFAPAASYELLSKAATTAQRLNIPVKVGTTLSADTFYNYHPDEWKLWAAHNVLCVEMEATALYTLAARHGVNALCILTISDSLVTHEAMSSEDRQFSFKKMMELALEAL